MKNWNKSPGLWLFFILVAGLILRIAFCFFLSFPHHHTDTSMYFDQAKALLNGTYINYAPNGYPLLIAGFIKLFTAQWLDTGLLWINIIMGTCSIWFVYRIAQMTFKNQWLALIAAAIMALYPNQLNYTRWILTEVPSTFLILACFYLYFRKLKFSGGVLLGLAVLFRTPFLPVALLIAGYELFLERKIAFRFLIGTALPLVLVAFYCNSKTDRFSITGNGTVNVVYAVSSYTPETKGEIDWKAPEKHPGIQTGSQASQLYFSHAENHPLQFLKQRFWSLWELWGFYPTSLGGSRGVASRLLIGLCNLFLIGFSAWCVFKKWREKKVMLLLFPFVSLSAIYVLLVSLARYTVPMEPFLIIPASWTVASLFTRIRRKIKVSAEAEIAFSESFTK